MAADVSEESMRLAFYCQRRPTLDFKHIGLYLFRGNDDTTGPQPFTLTLTLPSGAALEAEELSLEHWSGDFGIGCQGP